MNAKQWDQRRVAITAGDNLIRANSINVMFKIILLTAFVVYMAQAGYGLPSRQKRQSYGGCNYNCSADANWCNSTVTTYTQCLNDQNLMTTCRCICELIKKTDCYDKASWCSTYAISNAVCLDQNVNNTCCKSCSRYKSVNTNNCVDKANWCSSYAASCSTDSNVAYQCCATCSRTQTNNVNSCTDASWCASYVNWNQKSCSMDNNVAKQCCSTCSRKANQGSSCADASWCPSYVTSSSMCYYVETSCCKTCQARNSGNSACKYGDKYPWCSPAYCSTNRSDCCRSCP